MIITKGKYAEARVYADIIDETSIKQVITLLNQPYVKDSIIRMMPDIHAGAGCTIGTTMTIKDKVCPNLVGVDIGCGMLTIKLRNTEIDFEKLDNIIRTYIPSGFNIHSQLSMYGYMINLNELYCAADVNIERAYKSIGTLGGGNHFIEIDKNDKGEYFLIIHTGSRHLGVEIAKYYQKKAKTVWGDNIDINTIIANLRSQGREPEISDAIAKAKTKFVAIPKELGYLDGKDFEDYLHDMEIAQKFADINRRAIGYTIIDHMDWKIDGSFSTIHNYIDTQQMILRKGAISAQLGEKMLIPLNMRDGALICEGKGNAEWNCSAPHGAGRIMSRAEAKKQFSMEEYSNEMTDIYTTSVNAGTLDECPMAYKDSNSIIELVKETAIIVDHIKPVYNFKASEERD